MSHSQRIALLAGLVAAGLAALFFVPPIPQDQIYHQFADTRDFLGIPNFADVISNAAFAVVGIAGAISLARWRRDGRFLKGPDMRPYMVLFLGVGLVSLGSGYYHWAPSNLSLVWDRLPITVALMGFSAAIIADRIDRNAGNGWLLWVLVALGLLSVLYWYWTETIGQGDLRPYAFLQMYPIVLLPILIWLFPAHTYTLGRYVLYAIGLFVLSKVPEHLDHHLLELTGNLVSGHTVKHLVAALAAYMVLRMLQRAESEGEASGS